MPTDRFSLDDAREICLAPFLLGEQLREGTRREDLARQARRCGGVSWSGLGETTSADSARSQDQTRADAEAALARALTFAQSPRGRFLTSLSALDRLGQTAAAERARAAFARGFADPDRPACPAEIGTALAALARLDQPPAHRACLALAELLLGSLKLAAE